MSTRNSGDDIPVRRIDRSLAFMSLGIVAVSIVCFVALLIGTASGMKQADFSGFWIVVSLFPLFGLPIACVMIFVLLIMSFARRARANKRR